MADTETSLDYLGLAVIPSGTTVGGTVVGGLSGLAYDAPSGSYLAISDDRGRGETGPPRAYRMTVDLGDLSLDPGDVAVTEVIPLTLPSGASMATILPDPEGIALMGRAMLIASERDALGVPAIYVAERDGSVMGALPVPARFTPAGEDYGFRDNQGFESLTRSPSGQTIWVAGESAVAQDGPLASLDRGTDVRIVRYDGETGLPGAEHVLTVEPVQAEPRREGGYSDSGLVELLALDDAGRMLALERSFSAGQGFSIRLYEVDLAGATDVSGRVSILAGGPVTTASKALILDLGPATGTRPQNVEGMALGPVLPDGRASLVLVADDNFSRFGPSETQVYAFALPTSLYDPAALSEHILQDPPGLPDASGDGG